MNKKSFIMSLNREKEQQQNVDEMVVRQTARRKLIFSILLGALSVGLLFYYLREYGYLDRIFGKSEGLKNFRRSEGVIAQEPVEVEKKHSEEELLDLARRLKNVGFKVYGVTQCGWTRKQRELFGVDEARKVFESFYVECRSRDSCPSQVRGFPTWAVGEEMTPGFQSFESLSVLARDARVQQPVVMLQQEAEPVAENKLQQPMPPSAMPPPSVKKEPFSEPPATVMPSSSASAESDEERILVLLRKVVKEEIAQQQQQQQHEGKKVENARGVSVARPLAVPDMPGTAPWNVGPSLAIDQAMQGNAPRSAFQDSRPTRAISEQIAAAFEPIIKEQERDPRAADFASVRLPQATTITTGDALKDKRVMQL